MRKAGLIAALVVCFATHAIDWYAPISGWKGGMGEAEFTYFDPDEGVIVKTYQVEESGESPELQHDITELDKAGFADIANAYGALYAALQAQMMVQNMSDNLNRLFDGGTLTTTSSEGGRGRFSLSRASDGSITMNLTGVRTVSAGDGLIKVANEIGINGWGGSTKYTELAKVLEGKHEYNDVFSKYSVLVRPDGSDGIGFASVGRLAAGGMKVDGASITTNGSGEATIVGWEEATSEDGSPMVPCKEGTFLEWKGMADFFTGGIVPAQDGQGKLSLAGLETAVLGQIFQANGEGGAVWVNPPPYVSYDSDEWTLTLDYSGSDDTGQVVVSLPRINIEETGEGYTFTWRDLDDPEQQEITIPSHGSGGGVAFDDVTVTTNISGEAHLVGFENNWDQYRIPYGYMGTFDWAGLDEFADGESIERSQDGKLALKGYSAGLGANRYLGTDTKGKWGVNELPNVTTNNVVADEVTITTEGSTADQKVFRLKAAMPPRDGNPYAVIGDAASGMAFVPLPEPATNVNPSCDCSNAWFNVSTWINHDMREGPFWGVPNSWVDHGSVGRREFYEKDGDRYYNISLWNWYNDVGPSCQENLSELLTDEGKNMSEGSLHEIVCRYNGAGSTSPIIHYLPIGSVVRASIKVDNVTVTTNGNGEAELQGYDNAGPDTVPVKNERNIIEWKPYGGGGGGAIRIVGTEGEAVVGSGSATNSITFAAMGGSNVKVAVTGDGNGNATVTIGVYYVQ